MKIARVRAAGKVFVGRIEGDHAVPIAHDPGAPGADPLRRILAEGIDPLSAPGIADSVAMADCVLQSPMREPQKVLGIGLNYADHARESGIEAPSAPVLFVKTPNSIIGPDEPIEWAATASDQVDYEAELAVVIGRRARNVAHTDALSYVLGYTCCNDVSARDAQFGDGQWIRGKSFDTFCPLGPWIVTADEVPDPQDLKIRCLVNREALQDSTTAEMIFGVAELISYLSRFMTLEPGDVIATGTPFGVGFARTPPIFLKHGDVVEVEIERVGTLRNTVRVG